MSEIPKPDEISITTWERFRNEISEIQAEAAPATNAPPVLPARVQSNQQ